LNLFDRFVAAYRAFVLGPYVVDRLDTYQGHDVAKHSPPEYGGYLSTSNGVYACATQRAQFLSSLPLRLYKGDGQKRKEVEGGPLFDLLTEEIRYSASLRFRRCRR